MRRRLRVRGSHVAKQVRIAAADGNWQDACRSKRGRQLGHELVVFGEHRAISRLESGRQRQRPANVGLDRHLIVEQHEQMVHHEKDPLTAEIRRRVENVVPKPLSLAVQRLGYAEGAKMDPQTRHIGHEARDLFAGNEIRRVRVPIEKLEAAIDAVVIGDADQIHATRFGHAIDVEWASSGTLARAASGNGARSRSDRSAREGLPSSTTSRVSESRTA